MMRRIVVTGSECTGKTTLARSIAERLGVVWVPEQARDYAESVGRPLTSEDVEPIARVQLAAEDAAIAESARQNAESIVLDTDLVSTLIYARHYYGSAPEWIVDAARSRLGTIYLLCEIDVPWVGDEVRDRPLAREELHELFRRTLVEFGARPVIVQGLGPLRLESALRSLVIPVD